VLAEEMGRALAPVPFASTAYFFTEGLKLAASEEMKVAVLPGIMGGDVVGCYAASEGPGAVNAAALKTSFDGTSVSGTKIPVTDGDVATHAIILAKEGSAASFVLVDLTGAGVSRKTVKTLEPTRSHAELVFDGAPGTRIGTAGEGEALHGALMDRVAVLLAFEQLGGASRCLEMANQYAKERYAFGKPIGGNQAIKPASEAYWFASKENIQTHGGMGFTWEVDCHLFYRRAKLLAVQAGAPPVWKEKLVRALEQKNAA